FFGTDLPGLGPKGNHQTDSPKLGGHRGPGAHLFVGRGKGGQSRGGPSGGWALYGLCPIGCGLPYLCQWAHGGTAPGRGQKGTEGLDQLSYRGWGIDRLRYPTGPFPGQWEGQPYNGAGKEVGGPYGRIGYRIDRSHGQYGQDHCGGS